MLYQSDAHHYRAMVRRRRRSIRIRGAALLALSLALALYAVPCFAVSVWDYSSTDTDQSSISFSAAVSDHVISDAEAVAKATSEKKAETTESVNAENKVVVGTSYARANADSVVATTGPGVLSDDAQVLAAKKRAEAFALLHEEEKAEQAAVQEQPEIIAEEETRQPADLTLAWVAIAIAVVSAALGTKMLVRSFRVREREMTAAYGSALRRRSVVAMRPISI